MTLFIEELVEMFGKIKRYDLVRGNMSLGTDFEVSKKATNIILYNIFICVYICAIKIILAHFSIVSK